VMDKSGTFSQYLKITPELSFSYIGFNCQKPPFDDPDIRRAFTMAIDKDKIIAITYRDMLQKAYGILPPGIPGYNENVTGVGYDVAKAKQLIAGSKYGDASRLPPITLTTSGLGGYVSGFLEAVVTQWQENLGVEVKIRQLEPELFQYHLDRELDNLFDMGWVADYPHPQNFLEVLFKTGAYYDYGGYSNPAFDALLTKAGVEKDTNTSLTLYRQAEQMMVNDAACIPLWFGRNYYVVQPYVNGFSVTPLGYSMLSSVSTTR
jgi:oligopeptide transport system substrate-binding protein